MSKRNYTAFPPGRVKNIIQSCVDGKMGRAVPDAVAKALELFSKDLCIQTFDRAREANNKSIQDFHLKRCVERNDRYSFLEGIVSGITDIHGSDHRRHANKEIRYPKDDESENELETETENTESQSEDEGEDADADKIHAPEHGRQSFTVNMKPRIILKFLGNQQPEKASAGTAGCYPAAAKNTSTSLEKRKIAITDGSRIHSDDEYSTESDQDVKHFKSIWRLQDRHLGKIVDDNVNSGEASRKTNINRQKAKSISDEKLGSEEPISLKPRKKKRKFIKSFQENEQNFHDVELSAKHEHESEVAATNPQRSNQATINDSRVQTDYDIQPVATTHLDLHYTPVPSHIAKNIYADEDDYDDYLDDNIN